MDSHCGKLLVASPALGDPNFERCVLLLTAHTDEGAMGVILNRPSEIGVGDTVPELAGVVGEDEPVYVGGPVRQTALVVLAEFVNPAAAAEIVVADVGFVSAETDIAELADATRRARVYAGYAGWGPGQLEAELEQSAWIVEPPMPAELFAADPNALWSAVLERKGGSYAIVARMPEDPTMN